MSKICKDNYGYYAHVNGWVVRPTRGTKFRRGDNVKGKHFRGSVRVGMGKLPGRGKYEEFWQTDSLHLK